MSTTTDTPPGADLGGRPPHEPTDRLRNCVTAMAALGLPHREIARLLELDPKTLRKHYRQQLKAGIDDANAQVAAALFRRALGDGDGANIAAIFWLKAKAGWKERHVIEGDEDHPIPVSVTMRVVRAPTAANG